MMAGTRCNGRRFLNGLRDRHNKTADNRWRVPPWVPEESSALCTRCSTCFSLRSHRGVGSDFQFLQIINNMYICGVPWHRLALVDSKITELHVPLFSVKFYSHKS